MRRFHQSLPFLILLTAFLVGLGNQAQSAPPEIQTIFPMSCQRGQSAEIKVTGKNLKNVRAYQVNHPGISVKALQDNIIQITASTEVPDGDYDLRVLTAQGLSNPRKLHISQWPTLSGVEKSDDFSTAQELTVLEAVDAKFDRTADVDWYKFQGKAEQHVSIACRSFSLDGSAQPLVSLVSPNGAELMHSTEQSLEPVMHLSLPVDGEYRIKVVERAYRQDSHSFYRLSITIGPRLLSVFPSVITNGATNRVSLYGIDLSAGQTKNADGVQKINFDLGAPKEEYQQPGGWFLPSSRQSHGFWHSQPGVFGKVRLAIAEEPVLIDQDGVNDTQANAQAVTAPCEIVGRFLKPQDLDWYKFAIKKGESLSFRSYGDQLGQQMDLDLSILDATGKLLTSLKDIGAPKGRPAPLALNSLDAAGAWQAPADAEYFLLVRDLYGVSVSGLDRQYRILVQKPEPDFEAFAYPVESSINSGISLHQGCHAHLSVYIDRQNGLKGPVKIQAVNLPTGLVAQVVTIPDGASTGRFSVFVKRETPASIHSIQLQAVATIAGKEQIREVQSVTSVRPNVFRLDYALVVGVADPEPFSLTVKPQANQVVAGSLVRFDAQLQTFGHDFKDAPKLKWNTSFKDAKNKALTLSKPTMEIAVGSSTAVLQAMIPANVKPGIYSFWIDATSQLVKTTIGKESADKSKKEEQPVSATAISNVLSIEVVPPSVEPSIKKKEQ